MKRPSSPPTIPLGGALVKINEPLICTVFGQFSGIKTIRGKWSDLDEKGRTCRRLSKTPKFDKMSKWDLH
jgi:hypothetical protein